MQSTCRQDAAPGGCNPNEVRSAVVDDCEEGFVDRRYKDGAARVDFRGGRVVELVNFGSEVISQWTAALDAFAELLRQRTQEFGRIEYAAGPAIWKRTSSGIE